MSSISYRQIWPKAMLMISLGIVLGVVYVAYLQMSPVTIKSYDKCVAYGYPVSGTTPQICTASNKTFRGLNLPKVDIISVDVPFQTISSVNGSGNYPEKNDIITNQVDWQQYWDRINQSSETKPVLPTIDFSKKVIVGISQGPYRSRSVGIQILSVKTSSDDTVVNALVYKPGQTCKAESVTLDPTAIIAFDKQSSPILFNIRVQSKECATE